MRKKLKESFANTTYRGHFHSVKRNMEIQGEFRLRTGARGRTEKKKKATRQSNLWLTINTNRRLGENRVKFKTFITSYDQVLNEMFDTGHAFKGMGDNMIRFGTMNNKVWAPMDPANPKSQWNSENIAFVKVDGVIEEGGTRTGGRIHSHHLIQIEHTTSLQLDCRKIEAYINQKMQHLGVKGAYAHAKVVNQSYVNLLAYMGKDVVDDDELLQAIKEQLYIA